MIFEVASQIYGASPRTLEMTLVVIVSAIKQCEEGDY